MPESTPVYETYEGLEFSKQQNNKTTTSNTRKETDERWVQATESLSRKASIDTTHSFNTMSNSELLLLSQGSK